ncbi:MAG: 16S rRNA (guanine(966)-N(2))-methyltransferase RsmD [Clostridiales bacterium]|nr:16S rRNA (guanine(966)-N(2))-methyltransferase RsmD [Clostridiales bacterium]
MPRVVAGKCKGTVLEAPKGDATRPTTDKVKEAIFSSIQMRVPDSAFLDVFSGTGQMAIEALSRGAEQAVLIDQAGPSLRAIGNNLKKTHLEESARLLKMPFTQALQLLGKEEEKFDIVFMDPPYAMAEKYSKAVAEAIEKYRLLSDGGIFIVESDVSAKIQENVTNMTCIKSCKYGSTLVTFFVESETMQK